MRAFCLFTSIRKKMSQGPPNLIRQVVTFPPGRLQRTEISARVPRTVEESAAPRRCGTRLLNLGSSDTHKKFFNAAADITFFPHTKRLVPAEAPGSKTRQGSWKWIVSQAQEHVTDPPWTQAHRVGEIGVVSSKMFRRVGLRENFSLDRRWVAHGSIFRMSFAYVRWDTTHGNWYRRGATSAM